MLRKISGSFENTLSILEKLKTSLPSVTLHPDGLEIKNRMSLRLSNFPRNIYSLSTSLNVFSMLAFLLPSAEAYGFCYKSLNHENHYKFEAEGAAMSGRARDIYDCGTGIDPYFNIYEPVTQLWQGVTSLGLNYSAQLFRGSKERKNFTIEDCIIAIIKDELKKIQDEKDDERNTKIIIFTCTISITLACLAIILAYNHRQKQKEQMQIQLEDNSLTVSMLPTSQI